MASSTDTPVDYRKLLEIAEAAVSRMISPSAWGNLRGQIAADAVEEYLNAVEAGKRIHNPYAWVQICARWRTIDAMKKWERDKIRNDPFPDDEAGGSDEKFAAILSDAVRQAVGGDYDDPAFVVAAREWIHDLVDATFPDDEINQRLAIAGLVEGAKPRELTDEFDMDAKVISNRLGRIKAKLLKQFEARELA
jgi:DNA-directed RNA polymerase specialized sigma24 family protein